jgi:DNA-binding PadR family transcriptional regulator
MDSTRRVIETLCYGQIGRVMGTSSNRQFENMLTSQAILELDALSNSDKTFLIEAILLWLHHKRMREPGRETFKHAVQIEEAHHVLLTRKEAKETVVDIILREIRELGEAIIFLDQHPSLVSIPSLGNSYCTIAMNLKHGNDVAALSRAMLLDVEEEDLLGRLPVGEALVKLQDRWVKPFPVRFPHFAVAKGCVSDHDLRRQELGDSDQREAIPAHDGERKEIPAIPGRDDTEESILTGVETEFLEDVMACPLDGINERKDRLGMSARKIYLVISSLSSKGLIFSSSISTPKGRRRIIKITAAGRAALGQQGTTIPERNESIEHWYWKLRLAEGFRRQGHSVEIEKDGADLAFEKDGRKIAVEIETGKSNSRSNIDRDLATGFDEIIVAWIHGTPMPSTDPRVKQHTLRQLLAFIGEA